MDGCGIDVVTAVNRGHARVLPRGGQVDLLDPGARNRAAQEGGVQRIRQGNIVDECPFAAQKFRIDISLDPGAECACRHLRSV
jgi:hypothetical protein